MPDLEEDRFVHPSDIEVDKWGFFIGYGIGHGPNTYFDYKYVSYKDAETTRKMYPGFVFAVMGPEFVLFHSKFYEQMLAHVDAFDFDPAKADIYMAEIGGTPIFVSNHIPKGMPDSKTNFEMIADHSQCTPGHCVDDDDNTAK